MNMPNIPQWLIRAAVAVAVPTIACFGYYSLESLGDDKGPWTLPVILAYPMALIGLIALAAQLLSPSRSKLVLWLSALCIVMPILFLFLVRA